MQIIIDLAQLYNQKYLKISDFRYSMEKEKKRLSIVNHEECTLSTDNYTWIQKQPTVLNVEGERCIIRESNCTNIVELNTSPLLQPRYNLQIYSRIKIICKPQTASLESQNRTKKEKKKSNQNSFLKKSINQSKNSTKHDHH